MKDGRVSVHGITGNGVPKMGEMYPDLVCPARSRRDIKEAVPVKAFGDLKKGFGVPAEGVPGSNRHFLALPWVG
ncbi:MAG: hypothetical protein QGH11_05000, partial [Pirellulaceae bacterium]|nr:hypothetical protein [Pirellulaceae bacterium]